MQGDLQDISLVDLVRQNCQEFATVRITLRDGDREASVFIDAGQVSHAVIGDLQGERAYFKIIEWTAGEFLLEPGAKSPIHSIYRKWPALVRDGMERDKAGKLREASEVVTLDETPPDAGGERKFDFVRQLTGIKGVVSNLVVSEDGTVMAHTMEDYGEQEGAIAAFVGGAAAQYGEALSIGRFCYGLVTMGSSSMLVLAWNAYFIGLLLEEGASPKKVAAQAIDALADVS